MRYERFDTLTISRNEAERKAKTGKKVGVTFIFDMTEEEMVDRMMVANSPKVSVASVLRPMTPIPDTFTYNVPKAGTRASTDPKSMARRLSIEELEAIIAEKENE